VRTGARFVTTAGLLACGALVVVLHIVRPDLSPLSERLSEYAIGPHGWMMTTAFVALGCALATLGLALLSQRPRGITWIIPATTVAAGVGMFVSGVFETGDPPSSDAIHSLASISATVAVVAIALVHSLPAARRWSDVPIGGVGFVLALSAAALAAIAPVLHDTRWTGLGQRLLWIVLIAWLLRALWMQPSQECR
jgi:hypothetical protein